MILLPLFAWVASALYGGEVITGKLTAKYSVADPFLFNFIIYFFELALIIPVAFWFGAGLPVAWSALLLASVFLTLGNTLYTLALYRLEVSIISPLYNFRVAIGASVAAVMLGEILTIHQYELIACMFVSGLFVSIDERFSLRSFFSRGVFYALLSMLAFVLMSVYIKLSVAQSGLWTTTLWTQLISQILLLATIPLFKRRLTTTNAKQHASLFIVALFGIVATIAANAAYAINVSISTAIIAVPFGMVATIVISFFVPRLLEKHSASVYTVRLLAATIMFIAAIALS